MSSKHLANTIVERLVPFLEQLLYPGSLSFFEIPLDSHDDWLQAERYWKIFGNNVDFKNLCINYHKNPTQGNKNRLVDFLQANPALFDFHTSNTEKSIQPNSSNSIGVGGNVNNSTLIVGNNNIVAGSLQQVTINQSGQNRKAEIRDIWIDLVLPNGKYPTFYWLDGSGVYKIVGGKSWWEPKDYSYDQLMQILMQEINKWTQDGWEIIETDLDNVWKFDYGYDETHYSWLVRNALPSLGVALHRWRRYKGALFHVRHFL